jgi:tetratricopeptide (TPR) repeat protein
VREIKEIMSKVLLKSASEAFMKRDFKRAEEGYKIVLMKEPKNKEAYLGIMLCDLAKEDEEEALALYDYYLVLKEEREKEPEEIVIETIKSEDDFGNAISEFISPVKESLLNEGITYKEFKEIVNQRGSFKEVYEDIMFSTKVIITQKEELFDFIENLIACGFKEQVYSYIEDASRLYPLDKELKRLFDKLDSEKI